MRIGLLLFTLLFFVLLGLVLQSSLSNKNLAMNSSATLGSQPDSSLILPPSDFESDTLPPYPAEKDTSTIYKWDEELFDWVAIGELDRLNDEADEPTLEVGSGNPTTLDWEVLMKIHYKLKYYPELEMSIFAPVFSRHLEQLNGKTVMIEGYALPVDEEEGVWALSAFPIASCFFCGQASPASVLSIYLNEKSRRGNYKTGDKLSLIGTLELNYDDPIELYYLLKEVEVRSIQ